jgi:hypothetical protein
MLMSAAPCSSPECLDIKSTLAPTLDLSFARLEVTMVAQDEDVGSTDDTNPVACTLTAAGLLTQRQRWERLLAGAARGRLETDDGIRVRFRADAATTEELHHLVSVENECCAWASWTVTGRDGTADLVVRSTGDGVAVLHRMLRSPA